MNYQQCKSFSQYTSDNDLQLQNTKLRYQIEFLHHKYETEKTELQKEYELKIRDLKVNVLNMQRKIKQLEKKLESSVKQNSMEPLQIQSSQKINISQGLSDDNLDFKTCIDKILQQQKHMDQQFAMTSSSLISSKKQYE